jgi:hypothetical protein
LWGVLSDEITRLSFIYAAGPRQRSLFYCLSFETSLFVASYDSQGHGGGIRPRLRTDHTENTEPELLCDVIEHA